MTPSVCHVVALRTRWRTGLSLPVQQSRWPLRTLGALLPTRQTAPCIQPQGGLSLRCSRAAAPFGRSESPSISRISLLFSIGRAPPPVQQTPAPFGRSVTLRLSFELRCVLCGRRALPPGAAEPQAPFGCMGALHPMRQTAPQISLPIQCRTGLSLLVRQSLSSLRSQCEPSVCHWSYAAYSAMDEALPPGAAELQAPFSHSGSPPSDTSNRASFSAARGTLPSGCSRAAAPFGRSESPSFDICHRAPLLAACRARQSDAASRSSR